MFKNNFSHTGNQWCTEEGSYARASLGKMLNIVFSRYACNGNNNLFCRDKITLYVQGVEKHYLFHAEINRKIASKQSPTSCCTTQQSIVKFVIMCPSRYEHECNKIAVWYSMMLAIVFKQYFFLS